jgi:hypothetical protein
MTDLDLLEAIIAVMKLEAGVCVYVEPLFIAYIPVP